MIAYSAEINTLRGNINWMGAREESDRFERKLYVIRKRVETVIETS